jgi:hypothetical protein
MFCKKELNLPSDHKTKNALYHLGCWDAFSTAKRKHDREKTEHQNDLWLDEFKVNWIRWTSVHTEWKEDIN